ncbi:uncharacterized protein MKZ38_005652 [Zalerion maritima]|uniref:Uncharacterized protein n=1 Tax=Zalerion maritima TaxID=339359 RepID=A0AAD5WW37_9PEZI|nr:uncharacterized protein MKZ38_005652 [Zalerion maritima]
MAQTAHFASHLSRHYFDIIYWLLFLLVLFMLFVSSWYWAKCNRSIEKFNANSPEHRAYMKRCLVVCGVCFAVATASIIMEIYALMALQFCDGEDLMSLYWSTWTTLQLGSCIAICGIALSIVHSFRGRKHPPWGLALGTPVLVVAGVFHFLHHTLKEVLRGVGCLHRKDPSDKDTLPMTQAVTQNTLVGDSSSTTDGEGNRYGRVVGFGYDGGPIILLEEEPDSIPTFATLLGKDNNGRYIVAYSRGSAQVEVRSEEGSNAAEPRQDAGGTAEGEGGGEAERDVEQGAGP